MNKSPSNDAECREALANIIVFWPLYRTYAFDRDCRTVRSGYHPAYYDLYFPSAVMMDCVLCHHRQPWDLKKGKAELGHDRDDGRASLAFCELTYLCRACGNAKY